MEKQKKNERDIKLLLRSLKLLWQLTPGGCLTQIFWGIGNACTPFVNIYMSSLIIDELAAGRSTQRLLVYVLITLILNLLLALFSKALEQRSESEWRLLPSKLRLYLGQKGLRMDYRQIESAQIRVLRNRIEEAENSGFGGAMRLFGEFGWVFNSTVATIIAAVLMIDVFRLMGQPTDSVVVNFFNSPWASLAMAVVILILSALSAKSFRTAAQKLYDIWQEWPKHLTLGNYYSNEYMGDNGAGKDIRLYKQKKLIMSEFNRHFDRPTFLENKIQLNIKYDSINLGITALSTGITYLFVSMKVLSGAFGIGSLVRFAGLITQFVSSFVFMISGTTELMMNNNYMRDIFDYLDLPQQINTGTRSLSGETMSLEFDHVTFRYPDTEVDVLKDVSFRLTPGNNTALVGMNGSGKTTLIKLLCRLYDPTQGRILLNGVDIREYEYDEYLKLFSVVFQDFRLFSFGLGENVASGTEYDEGQVTKALEQAGFGDRLNTLPKGLKTALNRDFDEDGVEVSGGEGQKIALARALYKNAPVIILDEPTAALDPLAEAEVYAKFHEMTENKTAVYISHRLSSCRFCDEILVIENGCLVQHGSHEELVAQQDGQYYELWQAQAQYYV